MINSAELKKAIQMAKEATEDIADQDSRLKTYEIVLTNLIKTMSPQESPSESHEREKELKKEVDKNQVYSLLASKLETQENIIQDFFEIKNQDISLLFPIKRPSALEEQTVFLLSYLTAKKICYQENEVDSSHLREIMSMKQISNLGSLSTNMKKIATLINHKHSKIGSTKTAYQITHEGIVKGLTILKGLITKKSVENIDLDFLGPRIIKKKGSSNLSKEIEALVNEGFFNNPTPSKTAVTELRRRGFFNRRQDIDAYIRKVLLGKILLREKIGKTWHYVVKK